MITKLKKNIKIFKAYIMKANNQKPAVSKIVAKFDNQLREIIMNDLRMLKIAKNQLLKVITNEQLFVA